MSYTAPIMYLLSIIRGAYNVRVVDIHISRPIWTKTKRDQQAALQETRYVFLLTRQRRCPKPGRASATRALRSVAFCKQWNDATMAQLVLIWPLLDAEEVGAHQSAEYILEQRIPY